MLQRRTPVNENDTIFLDLKKTRQLHYRFNCMLNNLTETGLTASFEDRYLHTSTAVNMNGDTWIDFEVNADAASAAANRFYIVFKKTVQYASIKATPVEQNVVVDWALENGTLLDNYIVERSTDGNVFTAIGKVKAGEAKNYSFTDVSALPGVYYYRIKATSYSGAVGYSETVKVKIVKSSPALYVFPNPVTDGHIQLQMNNRIAGWYDLKLVNNLGQVLVTRKFMFQGGTATQNIETGNTLTNGLYNLEVTGPGKKTSIIKIIISRK